jgi:hypothetical protein
MLKQTILPLSVKKEEVRFYVQSNAYTETPNSLAVEEEPPFLKHVNVQVRQKFGHYTQCSLLSPTLNTDYIQSLSKRRFTALLS